MKKLIMAGALVLLALVVGAGCGKKSSSNRDDGYGYGGGNCFTFENNANYEYLSEGRYYDQRSGREVVCRESGLGGRSRFGRRGGRGYQRGGGRNYGGRSFLNDDYYFSGSSSRYAVNYCNGLGTNSRSFMAYQFYNTSNYACLPFPSSTTFSAHYGVSSFSWVSGFNNSLLSGCSIGGSFGGCACGGLYFTGGINAYAGLCF